MKKPILGIAIAIIFAAYSIALRHQHSEAVVAPVAISQTATSVASSPVASTSTSSGYKDGSYTGSVADAYYGNVQVAATISGGKITAVRFLDYPHDNPNSMYVNQQAMPYLMQEAVKEQSSHVSVVTGATFTSQAFIQSLASALSQAKQS